MSHFRDIFRHRNHRQQRRLSDTIFQHRIKQTLYSFCFAQLGHMKQLGNASVLRHFDTEHTAHLMLQRILYGLHILHTLIETQIESVFDALLLEQLQFVVLVLCNRLLEKRDLDAFAASDKLHRLLKVVALIRVRYNEQFLANRSKLGLHVLHSLDLVINVLVHAHLQHKRPVSVFNLLGQHFRVFFNGLIAEWIQERNALIVDGVR
mmetsp:Transcript_4090/g.6958  ORF Transcript_4090/g.6958 Transcript_4090/m.6958 type:complete len:207 (-) Transcript_4090:312-932(-)